MRTGRAISDHELDKQCEAYLAQRFGQRLDFDISGSLRTLLADGVVWRDSKVQADSNTQNTWGRGRGKGRGG